MIGKVYSVRRETNHNEIQVCMHSYPLRFTGTKFVKFQNLIFEMGWTTLARVINARAVTFQNCSFMVWQFLLRTLIR